MRYGVEFEGNDEVGYSAYLPELPGCVAAGETFKETEELIAEAVGLHLELMEEEGLLIPEPDSLQEIVQMQRWSATQGSLRHRE